MSQIQRARGGIRTRTSFRTVDFESTASAIPPPGRTYLEQDLVTVDRRVPVGDIPTASQQQPTMSATGCRLLNRSSPTQWSMVSVRPDHTVEEPVPTQAGIQARARFELARTTNEGPTADCPAGIHRPRRQRWDT
jgi:hypothetical protein